MSGVSQACTRTFLSVSPLYDHVCDGLSVSHTPRSADNLEHASHVMLSSTKLLNRIMVADGLDPEYQQAAADGDLAIARRLHGSTFGISSDPLAHFVIVFAALIHDVDHPGTSNEQLIQIESPMAIKYDKKSVAERHSLAVSLEILMEDQFDHLRNSIFPTMEEHTRFRQLLVNAILATDILDVENREIRANRWERSFRRKGMSTGESISATVNRRATSVLEHIIQASDVAHTMQHWRVFCKWNERLFHEMYSAYIVGLSTHDPSENWHKSQLDFFDNYVIPLARNLKECGVFGVSSDEYLSYALANRKEWATRGLSVFQAMRARAMEQFPGSMRASTHVIPSRNCQQNRYNS